MVWVIRVGQMRVFRPVVDIGTDLALIRLDHLRGRPLQRDDPQPQVFPFAYEVREQPDIGQPEKSDIPDDLLGPGQDTPDAGLKYFRIDNPGKPGFYFVCDPQRRVLVEHPGQRDGSAPSGADPDQQCPDRLFVWEIYGRYSRVTYVHLTPRFFSC